MSPRRGDWGRGPLGSGHSGKRGDLVAWISSRKNSLDVRPGVSQGPCGGGQRCPIRLGTDVDKEQRLGKRKIPLSYFLFFSL